MGADVNHRYIRFDIQDSYAEDEPDEYHMVPNEDIFKHKENYRCPCQPKKFISIYNANEIWIHNTLEDQPN